MELLSSLAYIRLKKGLFSTSIFIEELSIYAAEWNLFPLWKQDFGGEKFRGLLGATRLHEAGSYI